MADFRAERGEKRAPERVRLINPRRLAHDARTHSTAARAQADELRSLPGERCGRADRGQARRAGAPAATSSGTGAAAQRDVRARLPPQRPATRWADAESVRAGP